MEENRCLPSYYSLSNSKANERAVQNVHLLDRELFQRYTVVKTAGESIGGGGGGRGAIK